jgi:hypothetical protein
MKRIFYSSVLVALMSSLALPNALATCTQGGQQQYGYNYAYNGAFTQANCGWSAYDGATIVNSGGDMCTIHLTSYGQLGHDSSNVAEIRQYVTIPSTETRTNWYFGYNVEVVDPHSSASNVMTASFIDTTTSTTLGSITYHGNGGNPDCRDDIMYASVDLHGHTIEMDFSATVYNSDTYFRITNVGLPVD